jgi:hypothetical protein
MKEKPIFYVNRQPEGTWTLATQPPFPAVTTFITSWNDIAMYRDRWNAVDWFPNAREYHQFAENSGSRRFARDPNVQH